MSDVPVWLLDIDGVINVPVKTPPVPWRADQWAYDRASNRSGSFNIGWSRVVVDFINGLHAAGTVEVRWHTTWQHDAQAVADLVGLAVFPVAEAPEWAEAGRYVAKALREGLPDWWKVPAALLVVQQEQRPLIWTDDDIAYDLRTFDKAANFDAHQRTLLISPDDRRGLVPKHFRQIRQFLRTL